ncbi:MAG: DUF6519 domain-containing protein [Intrasporangium sp.]|uniref:DUF6519 domain-containing protein n=1 Tax=Intrasporangium sp. TaxID=1925024 RepID=UPI0026476FE1|nr:DUF6519 domain-containing protein [Intrasporangium sp.]MDN5794396.1 DUF6519 domain-containing protein [Intrasporangium sp.]
MHGGDLTRLTFEPFRHYSGVRLQQGRVQLDADWNEQLDISAHRDHTATVDTVGSSGTPRDAGGFALTASPDADDLLLSTGRCWVDGSLCETPGEHTPATIAVDVATVGTTILDGSALAVHDWVAVEGTDGTATARVAAVDTSDRTVRLDPAPPSLTGPVRLYRVASYATQPDLPKPELTKQDGGGPRTLDLTDGQYLAYLDVWERTLTALDAPGIREPALGGPDTATRSRTVWQLRLLPLPGVVGELTCADDLATWTDEVYAAPTGRMEAFATAPAADVDLCTPTPAGGYTGLENQLYRVQVHQLATDGRPIVLWSRENASVAAAWTSSGTGSLVVAGPTADATRGFASGDLVELVDDALVLQARPGTLVTLSGDPTGDVLEIDSSTADGPETADSVDRDDFGDHAQVRRWDCKAELEITFGEEEHLEHGVRIRFSEGTYRVGDYWLVPARIATADLDWPRDADGPVARLAQGVEHHYAEVGIVRVDSGKLDVAPCLTEFPSLTTLTASDVAVDGTACDLPGLSTVQDALDRLCRQHDLRRHHRLLHGWGIVCGLRVRCGPDDGQVRHLVTVEPGTALDPGGNDLDVTTPIAVDVLERLMALAEENPEVIDENGNADLCLTMSMTELGPDGQPALQVTPYTKGEDDLQHILQGTLLMDFYTDCIKSLHDWLRKEFEPPEDEKGLPVGPQRQLVAALGNLAIQVVNTKSGRNAFISPREDDLLQRFYKGLRERLESETFCAMFEGVRTPPAYPDIAKGLDTVFGTGGHSRVRMRPGGREAWTVGAGLNPLHPTALVNRYDLAERRLMSRIDAVAGVEVTSDNQVDTGTGAVTDVAFSPDGKLVYVAVPTRNEDNTIFRVGRILPDEVKWLPTVTVCGVKWVTLATTAADPGFVYAIGHRKVVETVNNKQQTTWHAAGLFRLDPQNVDPSAQPLPINGFFPTGHLVITPEGLAVAASMAQDGEVGDYSYVGQFKVPGGDEIGPRIQLPATGHDDIAVATAADGSGPLVSVVVSTGGTKAVATFRLRDGVPVGDGTDQVHGGKGSVGLVGVGSLVGVAVADEYVLKVLDATQGRVLPEVVIPLQVGPLSLATATTSSMVVALNYGSNTLSVVPLPLLQGDPRVDREALTEYRAGMLEAYGDLLGGFLQYLKDCFFDHFLVRCPQPKGTEQLYLAGISVRAKQVYRVCNFSRRRHVKSFPLIGYWLSAVPFLPLLAREFAKAACSVVVPFFAKYAVNQEDPGSDRVSVDRITELLGFAQSRDLGASISEFRARGSMFGSAVASAAETPPQPRPRGGSLVGRNTVGQPTDAVVERLTQGGVSVTTAPVRTSGVLAPISDVSTYFRTAQPGDAVTLFEQDGRVRYFEVHRAAAPVVAPGAMPGPTERRRPTGQTGESALEARLAALEAEIAELKKAGPAKAARPTRKRAGPPDT